MYVVKKVKVKVYVRHSGTCPNMVNGSSYQHCDCAKWLQYSVNGKQHREPAETRSWTAAVEKAKEIQNRINEGDQEIADTQGTLLEKLQTFIKKKKGEVGRNTLRRYTASFALGIECEITNLKFGQPRESSFVRFMERDRHKFYPRDITPEDVIFYRDTWEGQLGDMTQRKEQVFLKAFLKSCCAENLPRLLNALGKIKKDKTADERRKPKPFTKKEINKLLETVPQTISKKDECWKLQTMILLMVNTGLAIIDAAQLKRQTLLKAKDHPKHVLIVERQKTGKPAMVRVDDSLLRQLLDVMNGHPEYVFWEGKSLLDSEINLLRIKVRDIMKKAGVYEEGKGVFHRFRDTAVELWVAEGWNMNQVADALGDTVAVVERHYADWSSKAKQDRMGDLPIPKVGIETATSQSQ